MVCLFFPFSSLSLSKGDFSFASLLFTLPPIESGVRENSRGMDV